MRQTKTKHEMDGIMRYLKPVLIGTCVGAVGITAVLMLLSMFLSLQDVPQMVIAPMVIAALGIGSLSGGVVCGRLLREKGLWMGACVGLILFVILFVCGWQIGDQTVGVFGAVKLGVALLFSAAGGVLGANRKKRRK